MTGSTEIVAPAVETDAAPPAVTPDAEPVAAQDDASEKEAQKQAEERTYTEKELQERIQARAAKEERKFNRQLRAELQREREQLETLYRKQAEPAKADDGRPRRDDYQGDDERFIEDLTAWKADKVLKESLSQRDAETKQERQAQEMSSLASEFSKRAEALADKYPDFDEVVGDDDLPITAGMARAIARTENGPEVAYYLGKNPTVAEKLSRMHPIDAASELGRISAGLGKTAKQVSNAPAPVKPSNGRGTLNDLANVGQAEYEAARRKQGARWG